VVGVSDDHPAAVRWTVVGRVQGVGFRWFVREQARRWGLAGWVKNHDDGTVEIAASGPPESIEGLRSAVRRGPPGSLVTDVRDAPNAGPTDYPTPFSILRD
jgi:acylphosphatase